MNILLTGHEGYVGTGLFAYFRPRHRVIGWGRRDDIFRLTSKFLKKKKIDLVVNCAAVIERQSGPFLGDSESARVNVFGAWHLASILKGTRIRWIQISTKDVYGAVYKATDVIKRRDAYAPRFLVNEGFSFSPQTLYAKSKLMAEYISESHPFSNVIRLSTCYTDFDHRKGNWMVSFIKTGLMKRPLSVTHAGLQFRDPLHVDDLGRLIERFEQRKIRGEKINAGGGRNNLISLKQFVESVFEKPTLRKIAGGDYGFAFDNRKATALTGWTPEISIRKKIPVMVKNIEKALV